MQRFLLDTHVFLWLDTLDPRLQKRHIAIMEDPANELYFSAASIWELTIKRASKRLEFTRPFAEAAAMKGIAILPVLAAHAEAIEMLPRHHSDPFDHMLVAQASVEGLVLVTHDAKLHAYNVPMLRV
jgi:PIN domain nuclease of toxin-antitoxin system